MTPSTPQTPSATGTGSWSGRRRAFPAATRRRILTRDDHTCTRCPHRDPTGASLVADHIIPIAEGGTDDEHNGQTLCVTCHDEKTRGEIERGRARTLSRRRPTPPHPGLLPG